MDELKKFPKTYLNRKGLSPRAKYLFVSYSHKNSDAVYSDLEALYGLGLNFWYDTELRNGDIWFKIVEERLSDPNCCGAIFFFDENCLTGDAIEIEIKLFEKYKAQREGLFSFCVIAEEDESVYRIVRNAFIKCADMNAAQLQEALPEKRVITVLKAFNKDKIYKPRTGDYLREIVEDVRKRVPEAVADERTSVDELKLLFGDNFRQVDDRIEITFGSYPVKPYAGDDGMIVGKIQTFPDGVKVYNGDGGCYRFEPIVWILCGIAGNRVKLVCKHILDICAGDDNSVTDKLKFFEDIAFSGSERELLDGAPYIPSTEDIIKLEGKTDKLRVTAFASDKDRLPFDFAWLADKCGPNGRKTLCGFVGGKADTDDDYTDSYGGFMPAITIKLNVQGEK